MFIRGVLAALPTVHQSVLSTAFSHKVYTCSIPHEVFLQNSSTSLPVRLFFKHWLGCDQHVFNSQLLLQWLGIPSLYIATALASGRGRLYINSQSISYHKHTWALLVWEKTGRIGKGICISVDAFTSLQCHRSRMMTDEGFQQIMQEMGQAGRIPTFLQLLGVMSSFLFLIFCQIAE